MLKYGQMQRNLKSRWSTLIGHACLGCLVCHVSVSPFFCMKVTYMHEACLQPAHARRRPMHAPACIVWHAVPGMRVCGVFLLAQGHGHLHVLFVPLATCWTQNHAWGSTPPPWHVMACPDLALADCFAPLLPKNPNKCCHLKLPSCSRYLGGSISALMP